jgi:hypothetical protein
MRRTITIRYFEEIAPYFIFALTSVDAKLDEIEVNEVSHYLVG